MTLAPARRPGLLRRIFRPASIEQAARAAWVGETGGWEHHDIDLVEGGFGVNALARRRNRTNADISAAYGAIFAAVRKRSQAMARARLVLLRERPGRDAEELTDHPALAALLRVNESLTYRQGLALIEQHKLTCGEAYWIKRRNRLGVPVEFEIWDPEQVEVKPRPDRPWAPLSFSRRRPNGTSETVAPEDVVWFRYMIDPRNQLNGISPIGAVRVQVDTGMEALRFNQRFFDNNALPSVILSAKDSGPGEVARIEEELERKFKGTDKSFRMMVTEGDLSVTATPISHRDMEFVTQMRWTKEEVGMVFELSPILLGDNAQATKENLEGFQADFWQMIINEAENTIEELNEFYVRPDFGPEFRLAARFDDVPALQPDRRLQAELDEIELRTAKVTINELRARDNQEPVSWGDIPIVNIALAPLDFRPAPEREAAKALLQAPPPPSPRAARSARNLENAEDEARAAWARRLGRELRAILRHLDAEEAGPGRSRQLEPEDVDRFDWDWWSRYGPEVMDEIELIYEEALRREGFIATPLLPTHELAVRYAQRRAGELLSLRGLDNVVEFTRERVKTLVAETLENGDSLRTLKNRLRQEFAFSASRAEAIARTETAAAHGRASLQAYTSNGYEGKRWLTSGDAGVCAICQGNAGDGAIPLSRAFSSGHDAPPPHVRCRCTLTPVFELPRAIGGKRT